MKKILKVFIIAAGFVLCFNVKSFAIVDVAAWGGYIFHGDIYNSELSYDNAKFTGGQYGLKAHYNTSPFSLLDFGIGVYGQYSKINFDKLEGDTSKKSAGLDANLILTTPVLQPYLRGTWAFWDRMSSETKKFKAWGLGIGVEVFILPTIKLFGECMYDDTKHGERDKDEIFLFAVNFGLKLKF